MKELIKYFKTAKKNNYDIGNLSEEDINICVNALEKQNAKKPTKIYRSAENNTSYYCPDCKNAIGIGFHFCHICGKAIKWDNKKELK